jgi:hypothetical protein
LFTGALPRIDRFNLYQRFVVKRSACDKTRTSDGGGTAVASLRLGCMARRNGRFLVRFARIALLALFALAACAPRPADTAEKITRAIDAGDLPGAIAPMDAALAKRVTDEGLGDLTGTMQKLGTLQSVTQTRSDVAQRKYEFAAQFEKGSMTIDVAFDPDGKVSYFHLLDGD